MPLLGGRLCEVACPNNSLLPTFFLLLFQSTGGGEGMDIVPLSYDSDSDQCSQDLSMEG